MAASSPPFDALIVEASGISEPQQVAEAFDLPSEVLEEDSVGTAQERAELIAASAMLKQYARLDCAVSVVDALQFPLDVVKSRDSLADRGQAASPEDRRAVSQLLIQQVEFADILVLNKCDLASKSQRESVGALLRILNPRARIIEATRSAVDPQALLKCNAFNMEVARATPGWLQSLSGKALPESEEYGITHVVFRSRRPFHPARLHDLIFGRRQFSGGPTGCLGDTICSKALPKSNPLHSVVRSKGSVWFAATIGVTNIVYWAQAGRAYTFEPGEPWIALLDDMEKKGVELNDEVAEQLKNGRSLSNWDKSVGVGDRETELVFIGVNMNGPAVIAALQTAVVTESEWEAYLADAVLVAGAEVERLEEGCAKPSEKASAQAGVAKNDSVAAQAQSKDAPGGLPALAFIETDVWIGLWDFRVPDEEEDENPDEDAAVKVSTSTVSQAELD
jgi:G3E family GTPase